MKKFSMVGTLFALLAFTAMAMATTASAAEWLCNEKAVTVANNCLTTGLNLEIFLFQDRNLSAQVECAAGSIASEGWVGPGAEDEVTSVKFTVSSCKKSAKGINLKKEEVTNGCPTFETIEALNTPWKTLIEVVGGKTYDTILPGPSGKQPGYATTCSKLTDKCETTAANPPLVELNNLTETGVPKLVDVLFLEKLLEGEKEFAKCSLGGAESGVVLGETLLLAFIGGVAVPLEFG